jgi:hypothetical protein
MGNAAITLDNVTRFRAKLNAIKDTVDWMDLAGTSLETQALEVCKALRDLDTSDPNTFAAIVAVACNIADEAGL